MESELKGRGVLFVVPRFHTNLYYATRTLAEAGVRVSVFANSAANGEDHTVVTPQTFGKRTSDAELAKAIGSMGPDLIIIRDAAQLSEQVARVARRQNISMLAYNLKPLTQRRSLRDRLRRRLRGLPLERVTPVPGLDAHASKDTKAHYLPWPVAVSSHTQTRKDETNQLGIICVGKLMQPRKNQHRLVQSIREAGLTDQVKVTLVGSTSQGARNTEESHFTALSKAAEEDWIDMLCDHPFEKMGDLYSAADICVLPANREPLGYAPVEAMAYGVIPVISTDCGSAGYITHGQNGYRVDMERSGQLGEILRELHANPVLRSELSYNARITAETELGPERFLQRFSDILDKAQNSRSI